jgi:hypothetical protein
MAKGWIVLGFAAGYLVGSASGRKQFDRIKAAATDLWERPEVQDTVKKVDDFVGDKAAAVHDLGEAAVDSVKATSPSSSASSAEPTGSTS